MQDDLSIVFAGLLSAIVSNSLSDGLSVASGGNQEFGTFIQVALAELCVGLPFLLVILYFTFKQRSQKSPMKIDRKNLILILAVLNIVGVVIVMLWKGTLDDWQKRVWLIPVVVLISTTLTYYTEKKLFPARPSARPSLN